MVGFFVFFVVGFRVVGFFFSGCGIGLLFLFL